MNHSRYEKAGIADVARKLETGERLQVEDGVRLFECPDIHAVGFLAHRERLGKNGKRAYFIVNRHINYSNVCKNHCKFCAFSRRERQPGGYTMTVDEILRRASEAPSGVSEFHIVGGCHPKLKIEYYEEMLSRLREKFPNVHMQAFTAVEIAHIADVSELTVRETLMRLKAAGLGSIPGGGAEVMSARVRSLTCSEKLPGRGWLDVMREAHSIGIKSNATMLYGHVETFRERVEHLLELRQLQDETGGFMSFIPLAFHPANTGMPGIRGPGASDNLKTIAVCRLMLDNFPHIKAFWIMLTAKLAQTALLYGADDLDGTVVEEKITHSAGATTPEQLSRDELVGLIKDAGLEPVERDTVYNVITRTVKS
jgi:aminodeoxyfutalosine synthase